MNILVTGANGQLGTELRNAAAACDDRFIFTDVNSLPGIETVYLDITNIEAIRLICESEKVDVLVNCAAYTDVDRAESDMEAADSLNHGAAGNLAAVAAERGATLIHISTDYVFHGDGCIPYTEDSPTEPLGVYGATKLMGEQAVIGSGCAYIIFRTAWLYSPYGKNFVKTIRSLTAEKDSLKVVFDQIGSPTSASDLAGLITGIIDGRMLDRTGIYHYSGEGVCSWYDFACAIRDLSGNVCDIAPCRSSEYPSKASRPHYSVLDKTKVKTVFGVSVPHWHESLRKCIGRL